MKFTFSTSIDLNIHFRAKLTRMKSILNLISKLFVSMIFFLGLASKKLAKAFFAIFPNIFINTHLRAKYV